MSAEVADADLLDDSGEPGNQTADCQPDGYTCGPCQRRQHGRCRAPECTCCEGEG